MENSNRKLTAEEQDAQELNENENGYCSDASDCEEHSTYDGEEEEFNIPCEEDYLSMKLGGSAVIREIIKEYAIRMVEILEKNNSIRNPFSSDLGLMPMKKYGRGGKGRGRCIYYIRSINKIGFSRNIWN